MKAVVMAVSCLLAATAPDDPPKGDLERLQGTWVAKVGPNQDLSIVLTVKDRSITLSVPLPGGKASVRNGTIQIDEMAGPKTWDWVGLDALDGSPLPDIPAIYKLEGDRLTICSGDPRKGRPVEFKDDFESRSTLLELVRQPDEK
jgi:uncharacterized protein (TIGR03067 family)